MSGRRGFGVKADDLIDRMLKAAKERVRLKHPDMDLQELESTANALAIGALRFSCSNLRGTRSLPSILKTR